MFANSECLADSPLCAAGVSGSPDRGTTTTTATTTTKATTTSTTTTA